MKTETPRTDAAMETVKAMCQSLQCDGRTHISAAEFRVIFEACLRTLRDSSRQIECELTAAREAVVAALRKDDVAVILMARIEELKVQNDELKKSMAAMPNNELRHGGDSEQ